MIWSDCSAVELKHGYCKTYSVLLTDLDLNFGKLYAFGSTELYIGDDSVIFVCKNKESKIIGHQTEGKQYKDLDNIYYFQFGYESQDQAHIVSIALKHAIRLSQQP